jgi:hypothetical protein
MSLIAHGGEIAADSTKSAYSLLTTKGASNLLLHFEHPQVPLDLIVRKWNAQIVQLGQHLLGASQQLIKQILGHTLFPLFSLFGHFLLRAHWLCSKAL